MFNIGNSKYAPGTVASFATSLIFIFIYSLQINIIILILGVSIIFIYSVYAIDKLKNHFDLIFIDGGHTYSCIKNDTEKALEMIKQNGIILWHDYASNKRSSKDVFRYLEEMSLKIKIEKIKYTSFQRVRGKYTRKYKQI